VPVDGALEAMKAPFKMRALYGFSLPVERPYPDDFPLTGWVYAATVAAGPSRRGGRAARIDQTRGFRRMIPVWLFFGGLTWISSMKKSARSSSKAYNAFL
jgi:hypothetical protein